MLHDAEKSKGSIIRGMLAKAKERTPGQARQRPTLLSFDEGTQTFTDALSAKLGERLLLNTVVRFLGKGDSGSAPGFQVTVRTGTGQNSIVADHVIFATPTFSAEILTRGVEPAIADRLAEIEYAPIAVVSLGYKKNEIGDPLLGFGFLVPRSTKVRILGTVWNSSLFPNRAPAEHALLTSFIGGATDPDAIRNPEELIPTAHNELAKLLGIRGNPTFSNTCIYHRALPQYNLGHAARMADIDQSLKNQPNLHFVGNYLSGPSVGSCVERSLLVADKIIRRQKP